MSSLFWGFACAAGEPPGPAADPVRVKVSVRPEAVAPGGRFVATFELLPAAGIKVTRYPKVSIEVPAQEGVAAPASKAIGSDRPPDENALDSNYFEKLEPIPLDIEVDRSAPRGRRELAARLRYAYCVAASGTCVPVRKEVRFPITVR
jgi:hypothetical protein